MDSFEETEHLLREGGWTVTSATNKHDAILGMIKLDERGKFQDVRRYKCSKEQHSLNILKMEGRL